jgi:GNAT superfamily N-acetyltransferase
MLDETQENRAKDAIREVEKCSGLLRLSNDLEEIRSWQDHELANFVENRLGISIDATGVDERERQAWIEKATLEDELGHPRSGFSAPFWIVNEGRRIGTVAISTSSIGRSLLPIFSLYVAPNQRGRGYARESLRAVFEACRSSGLSGISLSTEWSWQSSVRFYLRIGMWVRGWKRALDFMWHRKYPPWRLELDGDRARFVIDSEARSETVIEARRNGQRLDWVEHSALAARELQYDAPGTFAVALAVNGFPLITSDEAWQAQLEQGFSDLGGPEGLAFKIRRFEAWDRKHGFRVDTPRIPGLDYPDWDAVD